jgi:hypothetical protein
MVPVIASDQRECGNPALNFAPHPRIGWIAAPSARNDSYGR